MPPTNVGEHCSKAYRLLATGQNGERLPHQLYVQIIKEKCSLKGVDAPSADDSEGLGDLWQGQCRPIHLRRQLSLPNLLLKDQGLVCPRLAQLHSLCISSNHPDPQSYSRQSGNKVLLVAPIGMNQLWLSELSQLLIVAPGPFHWGGISPLKRTGLI